MYARVAVASTIALLGIATSFLSAAPSRAADHDRPVIVAHRGASAKAPENTLAAVDKAAGLGFEWVENDVQRTKDGTLVVMHDETLKRTTDVEELYPDRAPWRVRDFTAAEIARLDAGSWFGAAFARERVPTLEQYLRRVSHHGQKLVLEIKNPRLYPGIEHQTLKVLDSTGWLAPDHVRGRLIVQSFSAASVRAVHALRHEVKTGFLGTPSAAELPAYSEFADQINSSHRTITGAYVTTLHSFQGPHGERLEIFTWTVDDARGARRVAGFGVDGIITNAPDVVAAALDH
jgi:glycerophosphoryl diester phosphodiesterase